MEIRVYYEDTDVGGVVYHANYLKFCERARSQLFFDKGLSPVFDEGHFVAKKIEADYIKSAKLGDVLAVKTTLEEMKNASFVLLQEVTLHEEVIFRMRIVLACLNHEGKMLKIPTRIKEFLLSA